MNIFEVKPTIIINDYNKFKVEYKEQWELLRNKIILDKRFSNFDTLKTLIEDFNILGSKIEKDTIETSIYGLVHINLFVYLIDMWIIEKNQLKVYYNQLLKSKYFTRMEYHLDFYMLHAISGKEVNFYLRGGVTEPMFVEEFSELKRKYKFSSNFLVISLNYMLYKIGIERAIHITSNIRELKKTELQILEKLRHSDPNKINIDIVYDKKTKEPEFVDVRSKLTEEEKQNPRDLERDIQFGEVEYSSLHYGKKKAINKVLRTQLDNNEK